METKKRESFNSRLGFILVSAGCAIGIGNVWKFPYVAGQNGGAVFVLFYLLFLVLMGVPVLTMELSIGRASKKTIVEGYKALEKKGSKWHIHGWFCMIGSYLLMMYYTVVAGWMLLYFWKFAAGEFKNIKTDNVSGIFSEMMGNPREMYLSAAVIILLGFLVLVFGVQKGLERVNKIMMLGLMGLILVLVINSFSLDNAGEGISFYLKPDFDSIRKIGLLKIITASMNQAFFTLSLGIASMEVFGSYMSDEHSITGEAIKISCLDTFVALASGFIIFPACFSFGIEPSEGPSLIFVTLPCVFVNMTGGRIWGTLFFMLMTFASFSTVTAVFENIVGLSMDNFRWSRVKSVVVNMLYMFIASIPCVLGYNIWKNVHLIGGRDIMGSEDFIVSNILLPIGALIFVFFCVTRFGWGADKYLEEVNKGDGMKMKPGFINYFRFVLPLLIAVIIISGLLS